MAVSDTRDYVLAVENNREEAAQIATRTAQRLERREATLIEVVQSLGEYINDEDRKIRGRAISYLTAIITALPPTYLSRQQVDVLCNFLCARIEDGHAVEGLSHLQGFDRFTTAMAQTVVKAMFDHFPDLQSHKQTERYAVLQLLNSLMDKHRKALKDMGDESLAGITALVHGEKDPRNLMLVFSMLRVLMVEWDISRHVDALFDSVYAYFPITFRPPPNDPYGITAQHLKDRLKDCLASNSLLAPYTFPNLLDRLDSTSVAVKKDVLQALSACAQNYSVSTIAQYSITVWDAVKFEVFQAQEPELAEDALHVIEEMAVCLSKSSNSSPTSSPLLLYLKPINKECLERLQEPAGRQAKAAGDILKAAAAASTQSFEIILKSIGPALLTIYQSADGIIKQRATLEVTNQLLEAAVDVYGSWISLSAKNPSGKENLLAEFRDNLTAIYSQVLMGTVKEEVSFRLTAANGLLLLSQMRSLLQDDEIGMFVQYYDEIILKEESYGRDELKHKSMSALAEISKFKPRLIADITFPAFTARLPDSEDDAKSSDYQSVLEALSEISIERELVETLMRRLSSKLDLLFRSSSSGPFPYTCAILGTVHHVLNRAVETQGVHLDAYFDSIVVKLSQRAADSSDGPLADSRVLDLLGRVSNLIVRRSAADHAVSVSKNVYTLFRGNSVSGDDANSLDSLFRLPNPLILSMWLLAALPRQANPALFNKENVFKRMSELITFAERSESKAIEISCLRQVALYVNKHLANPDLDNIHHLLSERRWSLRSPSSHQSFTLRLIFFLTKALILRLAPKTNEYLDGLADLLSSDYPAEVSKEAAQLFRVILLPDDVLSQTNFAQIRLLAPQRVFQIFAPLISRRFKESASATERETYLVALSGVLSTVPSEIVMPELPTLLPLLLQSLDLSDQTVKIATLETLAVVITNNPTALEESGHVPALTKRLLTCAALVRAPTSSSKQASPHQTLPRTRRLATRCLTLMPKYMTGSDSRVNPLLALKRDVLQGLTRVLDDPKRDVRKEAVDARAAWLRSVDDLDDEDDD
ncbi:hypothetical protein DV735_g4795, partial [Chaetothyriales sp. CBS 134920]